MWIVEKIMNAALGQSWRTSLASLGAGFLGYFALVGDKFPSNAQEWRAALFAAAIYAWGRVQKDANVSNAPKPLDHSQPVK